MSMRGLSTAILGLFLSLGMLSPGQERPTSASPHLIHIAQARDGFAISSKSGVIQSPKIFQLSSPERLVLDFDNAQLPEISKAERAKLAAAGVRAAFHSESNSTRIVFDTVRTSRLWIDLQGDEIVLRRATSGNELVKKTQETVLNPEKAYTPSPRKSLAGTNGHNSNLLVSAKPRKFINVSCLHGLLRVSAFGVTFSEALTRIALECHTRLVLNVPVDAIEPIILELGPAPPIDAVRQMFIGTSYNYIMVSPPDDLNQLASLTVTGLLQNTERFSNSENAPSTPVVFDSAAQQQVPTSNPSESAEYGPERPPKVSEPVSPRHKVSPTRPPTDDEPQD